MSVQLPTAASIEALHRKLDELLEREKGASFDDIIGASDLGLVPEIL